MAAAERVNVVAKWFGQELWSAAIRHHQLTMILPVFQELSGK